MITLQQIRNRVEVAGHNYESGKYEIAADMVADIWEDLLVEILAGNIDDPHPYVFEALRGTKYRDAK